VAHLQRVLDVHRAQGDGEILDRFLARRDEAAFAMLVQRHGPMVLSVCRRILGNHADADDAFQATFLVLVRKASSLTSRSVLGDWLHGVARRTALNARRLAARRRLKEQAMPRSSVQAESVRDDWLPVLDEELSRLPEKYRLAIVLCDLEGATREQAARQLGWPAGTVASRLARARTMLARRLARRGVAITAGTLTMLLAHHAAPASVPASLASLTVASATVMAASPLAAGAISTRVLALTDGVLKTMLLSKLKFATVVFVCGLMLAGGGLATSRMAAGQTAPADAPVQAEAIPDVGDRKADAEEQRRQLRQRLDEIDRAMQQDIDKAADEVRLRLLEAAVKHYSLRIRNLEIEILHLKERQKLPNPGGVDKPNAIKQAQPVDIDDAAHTAMEIIVKTKDANAKWMAVRILGNLRYERAVPLLHRLLGDPHEYVRCNAARALGDMRVAEAAGPLIEMLKTEDNGGVIQQTSLALGNLGAKDAVPVLKKAAKHEDVQTRMWVLQAIGRLGDKRDVRFLAGYLYDVSDLVQSSAGEAIEHITGADFGFPRRPGPSSPEEPVRRAREWWMKHQAKYD
jgi:RNA polymerase sigma factor (sigma-70 family)